VLAASYLGYVQLLRGSYRDARIALDHAGALDPTDLDVVEDEVLLRLVRGDLPGARSVLRAVPPSVDRNTLVAFMATYGDMAWVLDSSDVERLLRLRPADFDGDRGSWALALAEVYGWRGDTHRSRAYADSARVGWEAQIASAPTDGQRHALLGVSLAYLGQRDAAIREGRLAIQYLPVSRDALLGSYIELQLARIYTLLGDRDDAVAVLKRLMELEVPYVLTPGWLRLDPNFAPLRSRLVSVAAQAG
jgi:tetratricopeptide (TPR) repeat protein